MNSKKIESINNQVKKLSCNYYSNLLLKNVEELINNCLVELELLTTTISKITKNNFDPINNKRPKKFAHYIHKSKSQFKTNTFGVSTRKTNGKIPTH